MSRVVTPEQLRFNDPYQQRIFQYDTQDSRVYLSRTSNYLLKSIGNDVVIKGFDVEEIKYINDIIQVTLSPGLLIQDTTLIESLEPVTLELDISTLDHCTGHLIIYTNYQYIKSVELNEFRIKLAFISNDGLVISPLTDPWDKNKNRMFLNLYRFSKDPNTFRELIHPKYFYINGRKYWRRGLSNFVPVDDSTSSLYPNYYEIPHNLNSYKIYPQLFDNEHYQQKINTFELKDINEFKISLDEYIPFNGHYQLTINDPNDCEVYRISKTALDVNQQYVVNHNLNRKYLLVHVYNSSKELVYPRFIQLTNENSLLVDFSNLLEDESEYYDVVVTYRFIEEIVIPPEDLAATEHLFIEHNQNKFYVATQIINDSNDILYFPNDSIIQLYDSDTVILDTKECFLEPNTSYTLIVYRNTRLLFNLYDDYTWESPFPEFVYEFERDDLDENSQIIITHNLNNSNVIAQVFDPERNLVIPNEFIVTDDNNILLDFYDKELLDINKYTVVIYGYFNNALYDETLDPVTKEVELDLTDTPLNNPFFFCFDSSTNKQIWPSEIENTSLNHYNFKFPTYTDLINVNIVVAIGFNYFQQLFTNTEPTISLLTNKITINHNLDTLTPITQIYYQNQIVNPNNIQVIDRSNIQIDLSNFDLTVAANFKVEIITGNYEPPPPVISVDLSPIYNMISRDGTLSANSDSLLSTQRAIKTYHDSFYRSQDLGLVSTDTIIDASFRFTSLTISESATPFTIYFYNWPNLGVWETTLRITSNAELSVHFMNVSPDTFNFEADITYFLKFSSVDQGLIIDGRIG